MRGFEEEEVELYSGDLKRRGDYLISGFY